MSTAAISGTEEGGQRLAVCDSETEYLSLLADPKHTRAWKGGTGNYKMGG